MIEAVLNRLRGTGDIFTVGSFKITGVIIYTLYLFILISLISTWYFGLIIAVLFLLGESYAWGTWVSYLCYPENHPKEYNSKVGRGFPYIHYVANIITPQEKDYKRYCQVALTLRGIYWWSPIYFTLAFAGLITYLEAGILSILIGIGFPFACYLGYKYKFTFSYKQFICFNNWERQEFFYGAFQGIILWYIILRSIV